jgi:eukaryotic-like serine/threonine-protein kinase
MINQIGKYKLRVPLHKTEYSDIFVCRDTVLDVDVCVKLYNPKCDELNKPIESDAELRERFLREAKVMARMDHPNLIAIREYATRDDGTPYIVMPFLPATLKYEIGHDAVDPARRRKLPPKRRPHAIALPRALQIWRQVLAGLSALHGFDLVHRDVKPGNIFLTAKSNGNAKLGDFGMVKIPGLEDVAPGRWVGTPNYMAPEQGVDSASVDTRADVFSAGVLAFRMIVGRLPQQGEGVADGANAKIPKDICSLIDACRNPDTTGRPKDASAVLDQLNAHA